MSETNIEIMKKRMNKVHIDIAHDLSGGFKLKAESKVQVRAPKKEEKTGLVLIETFIKTPDSDGMEIVINAEFVFEFDKVPSDYNSFIEERCVPLAQEEVFKSLDEILIRMGYKKLELAEK